MKKTVVWALVLAVGLFAFAACKKSGGPGAATAKDMIAFMPQNVAGVLFIDVNRVMKVEFVTKALAEPKAAKGLQDFIQKTGLDPRTDISYLGLGLTGNLSGGEGSSPSGFGILNLKYDKAALVAKMKENKAKIVEGEYEGISTIEITAEPKAEEPKTEEPKAEEPKTEEPKAAEGTDVVPGTATPQVDVEIPKVPEKPMMAAFLNDSHIVLGPVADVKAVCDVFKKKSPSAKDNAELSNLILGANKAAIAWGVIAFKPEDVKKMVESTPMLSSLASLKAIVLYFDYANKTLDMAFKAVTSDGVKNKELADMITGFKAMGALASGQKPEIGELLNKIEVTSAADNVTIKALLPEELLVKLSKMAESEILNKMGGEVKTEDKPVEDVKPAEIK
ncbi:MAG: hypothetical protein PHI34_14220 [Acidobacteriota bacterium]|nr:hypothetical protein [Acidobacteriota bacterium]